MYMHRCFWHTKYPYKPDLWIGGAQLPLTYLLGAKPPVGGGVRCVCSVFIVIMLHKHQFFVNTGSTIDAVIFYWIRLRMCPTFTTTLVGHIEMFHSSRLLGSFQLLVIPFAAGLAGLYPRHGPGHSGSDLAKIGWGMGFELWEMEMEWMENRKLVEGRDGIDVKDLFFKSWEATPPTVL